MHCLSTFTTPNTILVCGVPAHEKLVLHEENLLPAQMNMRKKIRAIQETLKLPVLKKIPLFVLWTG